MADAPPKLPNPDDQAPAFKVEINGVGNLTQDDDAAAPANPGTEAAGNAFNQGNLGTRAPAGSELSADGTIIPQPNILDQYSSYTYSASVYLMSPIQYQRLLRSKKKNINGYNLLFQSGGAPTNTSGFLGKGTGSVNGQEFGAEFAQSEPGAPDYGRNPAFPQDFYIDSITVDNMLPGRLTGAAHMVTGLKFTVIEPGNITLLDRLYRAVQDMAQTDENAQPINYTSAAYLMVMRWYGYDENGKLVAGRTDVDPETGLSDTKSIVEKFIPFNISKINWSVGSKLVTYDFECMPIGQGVASGTRRGTVPYDMQITGGTVGDFLGSNVVYSSTNAPSDSPGNATSTIIANSPVVKASQTTTAVPVPPKAIAATSRKIVKQGLMGAMNDAMDKLVKEKIYQRSDTYQIEFVPGKNGKQNIRDAVVTKPGTIKDQSQTAQSSSNSKNPNQSLDMNKINMDISSRNWSITAGMQLVQAIDLAIRNSSYISGQALSSFPETTNVESDKDDAKTVASRPFQWFKISMQAEQGAYDRYRRDHSYNIKFIISEYELTNFDSKYFPLTTFRGIHKSYPFWFTGQNTAVLDFTANFNSLYNNIITGTTPQDSAAAKLREKYTSSMRDIPKYTYMSASSESREGADKKANEIASNAAGVFYSPSDMGTTRLRIIGDPAWIQQGDLCGSVDAASFSYSPFLPDGTINFDANQVMFEVSWQRPQDYDINTGLADPYKGAAIGDRLPLQSTVYSATKCVSEFRQGKFEQTIEGNLYIFPTPSGKNTVAAGQSNKQNVEARNPTDSVTTVAGGRLGASQQPGAATRSNLGQGDSVGTGNNGPAVAFTTGTTTGTSQAPTLPAAAVTNQANTISTELANNQTIESLLPAQPPTSNGAIVGAAANPGLLQNVAFGRNTPQTAARDT